MGIRSFTLSLMLIVSTSLCGQDAMRFQQMSFEQGLRSSWVFDIAEDSLGFMWVAGFTGLTRHDGIANKHYVSAGKGPDVGLPDNRIFRVLPTPEGKLLCSTIGSGLSIYDLNTGLFRNLNPGNCPSMPSGFFSQGLRISSIDYLYITGRPGSLVRFNPFDSVPEFLQIPLEWKTDRIDFRESKARILLKDPLLPHKIWIVGHFRLYSFDTRSNALTLEKEFDQLLQYNYFYELMDPAIWLDDEHLLLNLSNIGLYSYNVSNGELTFLSNPQHNPDERFTCAAKSEEGFVWLGTSQGRLFKFFPYAADIKEIRIEGVESKGVIIECITLGSNGTIYIGLNGKGLWKYHDSDNRFNVILPPDEGYLPRYHLHSAVLHPTLPLFLANSSKSPSTLFLFDLEARVLHRIDDLEPGVEHASFSVLKNSTLLTHSRNHLFEFDHGSWSLRPFDWKNYGSAEPEWPGRIQRIHSDESGRIAVFGENFICLLKVGEFPVIHTFSIQSARRFVSNAIMIADPLIYVLSDEQIICFNSATDSLHMVDFDAEQWPSEFKAMRSIVNISGDIYIASALGGIYKVKLEQDHCKVLTHFSTPGSILSNSVYAARADDMGYIWLSTDLGYQRFDPQTGNGMEFGYRQNLVELYRDKGFHINSTGLFASLGYADMVYGQIDDLVKVRSNTRLVVNSLLANDEELIPGIWSTASESYTCSYRQQNLKIAWSHLCASSPDFYIVEYKFEGFEDDWHEAAGKYEATYTNIFPGDYNFRIRIFTKEGRQLLHEKSLQLYVSPPFWGTWWFRAIVIALVVAVGLVFVKMRVVNIRKEQALVTAYNKQLADMEMQFLRAQMNPHFMFNTLNSIKHFILLNEKEKAVDFLTSFAQLVRAILQYSSAQYITLKEELAALQIYIELEQARFSGDFDFTIELGQGIQQEGMFIQPLIFQPYVENAIWHGLMHKNGNRQLRIVLLRKEDKLICKVIDNGIGRAVAAQMGKRSNSTRKSMGLLISEKRIKAQDPDAQVLIDDVIGESGGVEGTKVTLILPLKMK